MPAHNKQRNDHRGFRVLVTACNPLSFIMHIKQIIQVYNIVRGVSDIQYLQFRKELYQNRRDLRVVNAVTTCDSRPVAYRCSASSELTISTHQARKLIRETTIITTTKTTSTTTRPGLNSRIMNLLSNCLCELSAIETSAI